MINTPPSTQPTSEKWVVNCDKEQFILSDKEMQVIKQASANGVRGLVWFKSFAISIAHIHSIRKQKKPIETWKPEYDLLPDQEGIEKIKALRAENNL